MDHNKQLGDDGLLAPLNSKSLEDLNLRGCTGISKKALSTLTKKRRKVRIHR